MVRAIGWIGLLWLLCPLGLSAGRANEAPVPDGSSEYRGRLGAIFRARTLALRHALPVGGKVDVRFAIAPDGRVTHSEVARSSGLQDVDDLALRIVPPGMKLPPLPADASRQGMSITLPLRFEARVGRVPDSVRGYRRQLSEIFVRRVRGLPHTLPYRATVHVRFAVGGDGVVAKSEVAKSSGVRHIDDVALRIVPVGLKLPPVPTELPGRTMTVTLPLRIGP